MLKIKNDLNTVKWWQFPMLIVAGIVNATGVALFLPIIPNRENS